MSALTGVGPAMASGSQVCSGNCADLPSAPPSSSAAAAIGSADPTGQLHQRLDVERAQIGEQNEEADRHRGVADPGDDERLARGEPVGGIAIPEADQEIAAEADAFPAKIEEQQVVCEDQYQH